MTNTLTPKDESKEFPIQTGFVDATNTPIVQKLFEGVRNKMIHIIVPVDAMQKAKGKVEQRIFDCSPSLNNDGAVDWRTISTIHYYALEKLVRETGVAVDTDISELSEWRDDTEHHCVNIYLGLDEVQYYIASKLLEHDKVYYLESLFGVKSRDEFAIKLVYRNGVSSDVAILIDQSGKANISLPVVLNVLHGKRVQGKIAQAFDEFKLHARFIENPLVADTYFAVMKTLGVVDVSVAETALEEARNKQYPTRPLYKDFSDRILRNILVMEALDQVLGNAGIPELRRDAIWEAFKEKIGEKGYIRNEFSGKTIREGLALIGLNEDELTTLSNRLGEDALSKDFYENGSIPKFEGDELTRPLTKIADKIGFEFTNHTLEVLDKHSEVSW